MIPHHPVIILKSVKLINSLAFKNTMDLRRHMKNLNMFKLRDKFIIQYLQNVSELALINDSGTANEA